MDFYEKFFNYLTYQNVPLNYAVNDFHLLKDKAREIYSDFSEIANNEKIHKHIKKAMKEAVEEHIKQHKLRNNFEETKKLYDTHYPQNKK